MSLARSSKRRTWKVGRKYLAVKELKEIHEWHLALACDWDAKAGLAEEHLANARLALQVAAPIGTYLSVCVSDLGDDHYPSVFSTTRFAEFRGTAWSRMRGFNGMSPEDIESIANGVICILEKKDPRTTTPLRLFEQGLVSSDPYIRIFLWVTAIDSILMAVKKDVFVSRLTAFLGSNSRVFPPDDGVYINRPTTVEEVAKDLFELRSEVAHGRAIGPHFWKPRQDMECLFDRSTYGTGPFRYRMLLEEAALSLLSWILRKIVLDGLVDDFMISKRWKAKLVKS